MNKNIRFPIKVWNTLDMSDGCIATELNAQNSKNRKWAAIYPIKDKDTQEMRFRYFEIELPREILEKDLDWFKSDEITSEVFLDSLDELYKLLAEKNIDPVAFDVPWKFNYPYHY